MAAASVAVLVIAASVFVTLNKPSDTDRIRAASDVVEFQTGISDVSVFVSDSEGGIAVEGDMPAPAAGKEYQLWVVPADGSAPIPGPTMGGGETDAAWLTDLDGCGRHRGVARTRGRLHDANRSTGGRRAIGAAACSGERASGVCKF